MEQSGYTSVRDKKCRRDRERKLPGTAPEICLEQHGGQGVSDGKKMKRGGEIRGFSKKSLSRRRQDLLSGVLFKPEKAEG